MKYLKTFMINVLSVKYGHFHLVVKTKQIQKRTAYTISNLILQRLFYYSALQHKWLGRVAVRNGLFVADQGY